MENSNLVMSGVADITRHHRLVTESILRRVWFVDMTCH